MQAAAKALLIVLHCNTRIQKDQMYVPRRLTRPLDNKHERSHTCQMQSRQQLTLCAPRSSKLFLYLSTLFHSPILARLSNAFCMMLLPGIIKQQPQAAAHSSQLLPNKQWWAPLPTKHHAANITDQCQLLTDGRKLSPPNLIYFYLEFIIIPHKNQSTPH